MSNQENKKLALESPRSSESDFIEEEEIDYEVDDNKTNKTHIEFERTEPESIETIEKKIGVIKDVAKTCLISFGVSGKLLVHFKWDLIKLFEAFYSEHDLDKSSLMKNTSIPIYYEDNEKLGYIQGSGEDEEDCSICFDYFKPGEMYGLFQCKHNFCCSCWKQYFHQEIRDKGYLSFSSMTCPNVDCQTKVTESIVSLLASEDDKKLYERYSIQNVLREDNPRIKWCPSKHCGKPNYLALLSQNTSCRIDSVKECTHCNQKYCFHCQQNSHEPCKCNEISKWKILCSENADSLEWLGSKVLSWEKDPSKTFKWLHKEGRRCENLLRNCPNCKKMIEKHGGAINITCGCGYKFCWLCLRNWDENHGSTTGGFYGCNLPRIIEEEEDDSGIKNENVRELERFETHLKNYICHKNSYRREKKKSEQKNNDFFQTLLQIRKFLMNSYIFMYFLEDLKKKKLLKVLLDKLEKEVERFSEYLCSVHERWDFSEISEILIVSKKIYDDVVDTIKEQ